jgi:hypothetical protein
MIWWLTPRGRAHRARIGNPARISAAARQRDPFTADGLQPEFEERSVLKQRDRRAPLAPATGGRLIDCQVRGQDHAVIALGARGTDKAGADVGEHELGLAVDRMAEPTAAAGLDAHDIAPADHRAVADRRRRALIGAAGVDYAAPGAPLSAAVDVDASLSFKSDCCVDGTSCGALFATALRARLPEARRIRRKSQPRVHRLLPTG